MEQVHMKNFRNIMKYVVLVIMLASLSGIVLFTYPAGASAQRQVSGGGYHSGGYHGGGYHGGGYHSSGYHGRYYGGYRGYYGYHGGHYGYWYGGWWFPWVGIVPFLPFYYQTVWISGYPYYYADGEYYAPTTNGYMVVNPQSQDVNPQPQAVPAQTGQQSTVEPSTKLFIYPRNGQNEKQQADDRYQCNSWAVGQTGYDPTKPADATSSLQKKADYQRAMGACLDARGYSVK
jgi:hypothetical protein